MIVNHRKGVQPKRMSYMTTIVIVGLVGGIVWGLIGYLAFYLNFVNFGPALLLKPWALGDWKNGYIGQLVAILIIGFLSIGIAFLYKILFDKVESIWAGVFFGLILWIIVFHFLNPFIPDLKPIKQLDQNSIVTSVCVYICYGLFIGYSVSYANTERRKNHVKAK